MGRTCCLTCFPFDMAWHSNAFDSSIISIVLFSKEKKNWWDKPHQQNY